MTPPDPAEIAPWVYYLVGVVLVLANVAAWVATFFTLPGNWIIVALAVLSAYFLPEKADGLGIGWWAVVWLTVLAILGEVLEFAAGAAGAAKQGASRRSVALALVGAAGGSIAGAIVLGIFIPLVGAFLGALVGGAGGAFAGAYLGESWKGREGEQRLNISKGALVGRLLGTVGKLIVGIIMVAVATVASFA